MTDNLKTWPERIWLQHGDEDGVPEFSGIWNSHGEIFWCEDSVEPHNVEYVRADLVKSDPAGSADHVNDAVEMVDDSPGIVWKVTFLDGSSCHYGVKSTAQAAAGKCGTIEAIELKDKRFRLVEACSSAMSTRSTRPADVSIKAGEIDLSDAEIIAAVESTLTAKLTVIDDEAAGKQIVDSGNVWVTQDVIDIVRALLAAKGGE